MSTDWLLGDVYFDDCHRLPDLAEESGALGSCQAGRSLQYFSIA
jgi:hypothetical protein